jgi:K+-transporting ATPase ATPase A chain
MNDTWAGIIFILALILALAVAYKPLGDYMYRVVSSNKHSRMERVIYRAIGVNPDGEQSWAVYARSVLAFSAISILFLYAFMRLQNYRWLSLGFPAVFPSGAWNTAVSFVTNTNWQWYSGESTMGHLVQMAGLAVQNFASAAVGIAVAVALVRGFARKQTDQLGNFWVDLVRIVVRVLLPLSVVAAIVLIAAGAIQNFSAGTDVHTLAGATQHVTGGPVASQEAIKDLGTNGGGFYNANSAHPFENPTSWTNWLEIFILLVIGFSLPRTFGRMVNSNKQGYAIVAAMAIMWIGSVMAISVTQGLHNGTVPTAVGAAAEGTEQRFGVLNSAVFASSTTLTSTGSIDSFHDSYTALGGGITIVNMMLGEVAPGGTGSGLYGILILAVLTVFIAGLMVGRTPEYLGKKIGGREVKLASLYFLTMPTVVLIGTGLAMAFPAERAAMANPNSAHGLSEVLYAFTSATNNNGSAFAGLTVSGTWYNTALGVCMLIGRFLPMVFVLGLAGSLAKQRMTPESAGTLRTYQPLFVGMLVGVTLILVALTFLPALALGPLAEGVR